MRKSPAPESLNRTTYGRLKLEERRMEKGDRRFKKLKPEEQKEQLRLGDTHILKPPGKEEQIAFRRGGMVKGRDYAKKGC